MLKIFGLVGAGGYGRETIHFIKNSSEDFDVYFIDKNIKTKNINGIKVITDEEFLNIKNKEKYFNVSVSNSKKRKSIADNFKKNGAIAKDLHAKSFINHEAL